jgi:hypothetical protein
LGPKIGFEAIGLVDSSLQTVGLFAKADSSDTPAAQVNETNETLRSEVNNDSNVTILGSYFYIDSKIINLKKIEVIDFLASALATYL